jgi:hypothetical protein
MKARTLIVFALFLYVSSMTAFGLSLQDIPMIPGTTLSYSQYFGKEHLVAEYRVFLPDSMSFRERMERGRVEAQKCVEFMKNKGWKLKKENLQRRGGEFAFKKEVVKEANLTVAPGSKSLEGKRKHYIFFKFQLKRLIPFEDVTGYDLPDVPRFPGSLRVRWMHLLGDYAGKYKVVGKIEAVKKFFAEKIREHGWKPGKGPGTLNYLKGGYTDKKTGAPGGDKKDVSNTIKKITKMIPTTLSIHLSEDEGIVDIGIGRSAGGVTEDHTLHPLITPVYKPGPAIEKPLTVIDLKKDIPLYPGLKHTYSEQLPVNLNGEEIHRLSLEMKQAEQGQAIKMAKFYLEEMKTRGWEIKDDEWYGLGRVVLFRKGAVKVKMNIKAIGRYPVPANARKINIPVEIDVVLPIPGRDIEGKDIDKVPRFPDSIRYYYLQAARDHTVKYKAAAPVKEVEWYYVKTLPQHGWTFSGFDKTGLLFVPGSTARSAADALAKGKLVPTTLKLKVDDLWNGTVKIGLTRTKGD